MEELRVRRELANLSQIALAGRADVSRMRLQLAEAGEITLRPEEVDAVNRVLHNAIKRRAATLKKALVRTVQFHAGRARKNGRSARLFQRMALPEDETPGATC